MSRARERSGSSLTASRPPGWALAISVATHALMLALLTTVRSPKPHRAQDVRVTLIAPPLPAPRRSLKIPPPPARLARSKETRTFRVPNGPHHQPEPAQVTSVLDPSLIQTAPIAILTEVPTTLNLPPAPRSQPKATGAFDTFAAPVREPARAAVIPGNFGDASVAIAAPRANPSVSSGNLSANFSAAEVLFKPRPAYSEEARQLRIEGEVLIQVLFGASGEVRVLRLIEGLGHGLDENAIAAAREIRFRPARRDGVAVDSLAVVHIVFQLAN